MSEKPKGDKAKEEKALTEKEALLWNLDRVKRHLPFVIYDTLKNIVDYYFQDKSHWTRGYKVIQQKPRIMLASMELLIERLFAVGWSRRVEVLENWLKENNVEVTK